MLKTDSSHNAQKISKNSLSLPLPVWQLLPSLLPPSCAPHQFLGSGPLAPCSSHNIPALCSWLSKPSPAPVLPHSLRRAGGEARRSSGGVEDKALNICVYVPVSELRVTLPALCFLVAWLHVRGGPRRQRTHTCIRPL